MAAQAGPLARYTRRPSTSASRAGRVGAHAAWWAGKVEAEDGTCHVSLVEGEEEVEKGVLCHSGGVDSPCLEV